MGGDPTSSAYIILSDGLGNDRPTTHSVVIRMICNVPVIVLLEISFVWRLLTMHGETEEQFQPYRKLIERQMKYALL